MAGKFLLLTSIFAEKLASRKVNTVRRRVRVAHDFQYGPEEFGRLPFWAHLMPLILAQFHTILALVIFSNGLVYIMGLCGETILLDRSEVGVFFWPLLDADVICT